MSVTVLDYLTADVDIEGDLDRERMKEDLARLLHQLTPREHDLVAQIFGLGVPPRPIEQIAQFTMDSKRGKRGVPVERIQRRLQDALVKLRCVGWQLEQKWT